jgi:hypothetical protein
MQSHHYHKQPIPEQNSGKYNVQPNVPTGLRATSHAAPYQVTGPTPTPPKTNKPVDPQLATSQQLQVHATHTKNC